MCRYKLLFFLLDIFLASRRAKNLNVLALFTFVDCVVTFLNVNPLFWQGDDSSSRCGSSVFRGDYATV